MTQRDRFLPNIGAGSRVSAETAMIDRFQLKVGRWYAHGTRDEISAKWSLLSAHEVETSSGTTVPWFQSRNFRSDYRRLHLSFRSTGRGPQNIGPRPLLSGNIFGQLLGRNIPGSVQEARCAIEIDATWNLSRFLQAHELFIRTKDGKRGFTAHNFPNAIEPKPEWWRNERPLVVCDNLIIGDEFRYRFVMNRPLETHLSNYVAGTLATFVQALQQHELIENNSANVSDFSPEDYQLGDIEFYWEFNHDTPITFVDTLTHFLPRVAKRMRVTRAQIERTEREVSHQSQSATIYLTRDRRLRVYAKTDRRVRFEVTFPDGYRSTSHRRSSFQSMEDFLLAVENLKAEAAQTLNDVFAHLWHWEEKHEMDATPDQLRAAIAAASETPFIATTIIHNLAKNGRLALAAGDPIRATVQRLAQSNPPVLKTLKSDRRIYVVERRFEYARRNLHMV